VTSVEKVRWCKRVIPTLGSSLGDTHTNVKTVGTWNGSTNHLILVLNGENWRWIDIPEDEHMEIVAFVII